MCCTILSASSFAFVFGEVLSARIELQVRIQQMTTIVVKPFIGEFKRKHLATVYLLRQEHPYQSGSFGIGVVKIYIDGFVHGVSCLGVVVWWRGEG